MRKYLFIFMLLGLALAACRAESNITMTINEDGSATVGAEVGFDEEFADLISQAGQDPAEAFEQEFPQELGIEPYTRTQGDMTFYGFSRDVEDLAQFDISELGQEMTGNFAEFSYTSDEETAVLVASLNSADLGGGLGDLGLDPSDITGDIFSANIIVTMPGTVVEHNADEVRSDGSLVWTIPLNGSVSISAVSEFGSGSPSWLIWVILGVLLIGIAAGVGAVLSSRNDSKKAVEEAAAAHAASPPPPPQTETPSQESSAEAENDDTDDTSGDDDADSDSQNDES